MNAESWGWIPWHEIVQFLSGMECFTKQKMQRLGSARDSSRALWQLQRSGATRSRLHPRSHGLRLNSNKYEGELTREAVDYELNRAGVQIDPRKVYDLPELIDIAQRNNPETRVAWERAREAAAAVGLVASTYYPYLAASAGAGYSRMFPSLSHAHGRSASTCNGTRAGRTRGRHKSVCPPCILSKPRT